MLGKEKINQAMLGKEKINLFIVSSVQITQSLSVGKPPVSTATSLPSPTTSVQTIKTSTTAAQPVSSTPKTVVMTTLVGTKRVVLSVPAAPTTSLQGTGIAKSHGEEFKIHISVWLHSIFCLLLLQSIVIFLVVKKIFCLLSIVA